MRHRFLALVLLLAPACTTLYAEADAGPRHGEDTVGVVLPGYDPVTPKGPVTPKDGAPEAATRAADAGAGDAGDMDGGTASSGRIAANPEDVVEWGDGAPGADAGGRPR